MGLQIIGCLSIELYVEEKGDRLKGEASFGSYNSNGSKFIDGCLILPTPTPGLTTTARALPT